MNSKKAKGKIRIDLDVLPDAVALVDADAINRLVGRVLAQEGVEEPVEVGLTITDDQHIRELNASYRGIDQATDVLSFPLSDAPGGTQTEFVTPPALARSLGDVVISYERAVAQAREYGHSIDRELGFLLVHGILHLLGYDHETESQRTVMREKEEAALIDLPR